MNSYNTSNPETLLLLKRQEADALRDVIRSFNIARLKPQHIFKIAQNTLLAQLGVKKMRFLYRHEGVMAKGIDWGYAGFAEGYEGELPEKVGVYEVSAESHPKLHAAGVENVVAVLYRSKVGAWFLVGDFYETENERRSDLIFIETLGNLLSAAIENRFLVQEIVQQETLRRELEVAEKIQQSLLSDNFEDIVGAEISAHNVPHHRIGGDFYDLIPRGDLGFFVCIADVAGKGIGAALLMANLQAQVRALILSQNSLEDVIRRLHKSIMEVTKGEQFVTFFLAHVRTRDQEIDFINAGHNHPLLVRKDGMEPMSLGTIPLGILDIKDVREGTVSYEPGDVMFLYTDGLAEQENEAGELFDDEGVRKGLQGARGRTAEDVVMQMELLLKDHAGGVEASDDITMLAVKFS